MYVKCDYEKKIILSRVYIVYEMLTFIIGIYRLKLCIPNVMCCFNIVHQPRRHLVFSSTVFWQYTVYYNSYKTILIYLNSIQTRINWYNFMQYCVWNWDSINMDITILCIVLLIYTPIILLIIYTSRCFCNTIRFWY